MTEPLPRARMTAERIALTIQVTRTLAETLFRLPVTRTLYCPAEDTAWYLLCVEQHPWLSAQNISVQAHPYIPEGHVSMTYGAPPETSTPDWHPDLLDAEANALYWNPGTLGGAV